MMMHSRQYQNKSSKANTIRSSYSRTSKYSSYYERSSIIHAEEADIDNFVVEEEKRSKYLAQIPVPKYHNNQKTLSKYEIYQMILKKIKYSNVFIPKEIYFEDWLKPLFIPQSLFNDIKNEEVIDVMNDNYKLVQVSCKNNLYSDNKMVKKFSCNDSDNNDNFSIDSFYNDRKIKKLYSREMDMINHMIPEAPKRMNRYNYSKKEQVRYNKNQDYESGNHFYVPSFETDHRDKNTMSWNDNHDNSSKIEQYTSKGSCFSFQTIYPVLQTLSKIKYQNVCERDNSPVRRILSSSIYVPRKIVSSETLNVEVVNVISPSFIYIREINHIAENLTIRIPMELKVIRSELEDIIHYNADELFEIQNCKEPFLWRYCIAPLDDKSLGRARIIQKITVNNNGALSNTIDDLFLKVFFLDYGTTSWVHVKCCYLFPYPEWYAYPPQVIPITLIDVTPKCAIDKSFEGIYKWPISICSELTKIISGFKSFEFNITNVYSQKVNKMFTYGGYLYGFENLIDDYNDKEKVNISSILIWKFFDKVIHNNINEYFNIPDLYDIDTEYIVDFNSLPNHLKIEHKLIKTAHIIAAKKMTEHFSEDECKNKKKIRIPPLLVPLDVWPRGNLPWDYDTLVYSGFVNNSIISFIPNDQSPNVNCFSFSVIPLLNYQIEQSFVEENVICNLMEKILKAKNLVDDALSDFYRIKDNRRCFNWEYVQGKLEVYEPVNCIVGLIDEGDAYTFNCRRARIHYLVENFAEEFDLFAKGIVPTHRKKHIRYVIVELYDYADIVVVPTDSICQIHPMHDIINPFSLRMSVDYDIGNTQLSKLQSLIKCNPPEVISLKKMFSEIVCVGTPKRAILQSGPCVGMKKRYKFEYFIRPWKDPFTYKIRYVTELWSDKTIFLDKNILLSSQYFKNLRHFNKIEYIHQFNKISRSLHDSNHRMQSMQKRKKILTKGINSLKSLQNHCKNNN
uniref:Tudor domain-containing protein n=1 Tax=Strongyloides venezuelensis TaxID=75913 RepID=A0A0K0FVN1_STRVS